MGSYIVVNGKDIEYGDVHAEIGEQTVADIDWTLRAKNLLKGELKRRGVSYKELADKLTAMDIPESERNIANKISRGGFTGAFMLQCFAAIGATTIRLDD
jgi:hypothetical protein